MKLARFLFVVLGVAGLAARADAQTLYGTTASNQPGQLVTLNPATGAVLTTVGPTNDATGNLYGLTGLAYNPVNGLLYGSSGNGSNYTAATRLHLVTVNPTTGRVTDIGAFAAGTNTMTDLAFNSTGQLFGIGSAADARLFSINLTTGAATAITPANQVPGTVGGGLAVHPTTGVFNGSPLATNFGTYNPTTGAYTDIAAPAPLPLGAATSSLTSLDFNPAGVLYASNTTQTNGGTVTPSSHLVIINSLTAAVTDVGPSINGLDAIAFVPVPEPGTVMLIAAPVAFVLARFRRR